MSNQEQKRKLKSEGEGVSKLAISKDRNWTDHQLIQLSAFMIHHIDKFQTKQQRRESKVYAVLSKYITTRNINQCRNYVNKLFRKFKSYHQIISFFQQSLHNYDARFKEESIKVQKIIFPLRTIQKEMQKISSNNYKSQQNIYSEDCSLEDQIKYQLLSNQKELKPTDVGYYEADCSPKHEESKSEMIHFVQKERSSDQGIKFSEIKPPIFDFFNFQFDSYEQQNGREKGWKDCHKMFFDWALKATNLIEKYATQPPYLQCFS